VRKKRVIDDVVLVDPPILHMNQRAIQAHLSQRVLHQEVATNAMATLLYRATRPRTLGEGDGVRVVSALLSGVSGTGKTMICEEAQKLMLTGRGQQYEGQYVTRHLGGVDEGCISMFSGCGAGLEGYGAVSLAQKLKEAYEPVGGKPPPYVVVQFDELDSCDRKVMDALNSLLDRGVMELTSEMTQVRPDPSTTLIILFTANYASDSIDPLDSMASSEAIKRRMRKAGINDCDIGRINWIIPFRAFTVEEMQDIFIAAKQRLLQEHPFTKACDVPLLTTEANSRLVASVMQYYDTRLGVRGAMHLYKREMESLLDNALMALEEAGIDGKELQFLCQHVTLNIVEGCPTLEKAKAEHYDNRERLRCSVERKCPTVDVLVMTHPVLGVFSSFILLPERAPSVTEEEEGGKKKKQRCV